MFLGRFLLPLKRKDLQFADVGVRDSSGISSSITTLSKPLLFAFVLPHSSQTYPLEHVSIQRSLLFTTRLKRLPIARRCGTILFPSDFQLPARLNSLPYLLLTPSRVHIIIFPNPFSPTYKVYTCAPPWRRFCDHACRNFYRTATRLYTHRAPFCACRAAAAPF